MYREKKKKSSKAKELEKKTKILEF